MIRKCIDSIRTTFPESKDSRFERALGLGKGTLEKMYEKNSTNKVNAALLRVVGAQPFLIQVAESGYDSECSKHFEAMWISEQLLKRLRCF